MNSYLIGETIILAAKDKKTEKNKETDSSDEVKNKTTKEITTEVQATDNAVEAKKVNFDWENPSWDLFLIAFFVVGSLLYGISLGKDRIIGILVSIYMALAVVHALPDFVLNIKVNENFTFQITAFLAIFVVLFFLISRSAVLNSLDTSQQGRWWQVIIFSFLHVGLLVSVSMSFMPDVFINKFADITKFIFTNEWTSFGWIITPIIAMIVFGRREE